MLEKEQEKEQEKEPVITDANAFNEWINKKEKDINKELFRKHFNFQRPSEMLKFLYQTNDKERKNELVNVINSGLKDLKKEIKKMSEKEINIEKHNKIVKIVEDILTFIKQKKRTRHKNINTKPNAK